MQKTLDFNSVERPTIKLTMKDEAHTVINVTTPSEALIEKLQANQADIVTAAKGGDLKAVNTVVALMADLVSCNLEGVTVTEADLRGKYHVSLADAIIFFTVYNEFIDEIKTAKN